MLKNLLKPIFTAMGFLTRFPTPRYEQFSDEDFGKGGAWYPLVGGLIGSILVLIAMVSHQFLPGAIGALFLVIVWEWMTGFLHLDGLADCGDALIAEVPTERRWEILHDSRLGTFGAVSLIFHLLGKVLTIQILVEQSSWFALLAAPVFARWVFLAVARQPLIAQSKIGSLFQKGFKLRHFFIASVLPVVLAAYLKIQGLVALVIILLAALGLARFAQKRLGGINGDVFGMIIEVTELLTLIIFSIQ
jgi:adenosylcobinamide-GDP ribazoletransferase